MKTPLRYQMTEYDCGPTSLLNAISYLFEREQIPPDIVRNIMLYSLDTYDMQGSPGREGTSGMAMMFLSNWFNGYGKAGLFPVAASYISREEVSVGTGSRINSTLERGGAAVVRLYLDVGHYVLFTGTKEGCIRMFDPYLYTKEDCPEIPYELFTDNLGVYNRIVPFDAFNREDHGIYSLGEIEKREAVLLFNTDTMLSEEDVVEYFI